MLIAPLALALAACVPLDARAADTPASVIIAHDRAAKGAAVTRLKEPWDNYFYTRLTPPPIPVLLYTVKPEEAGEWYVNLDVRVGAAVALDQKAAFATIERPAASTNDLPEVVASMRITGSKGDEAWQLVSFGRQKLEAGMQIRIVPGAGHPPHYIDLRRISLLAPRVMESTTPSPPAAAK